MSWVITHQTILNQIYFQSIDISKDTLKVKPKLTKKESINIEKGSSIELQVFG